MSEPNDDTVEKAKLKREKAITRHVVLSIIAGIGGIRTRTELVAYLRKVASRIHADIITEKEMLRK